MGDDVIGNVHPAARTAASITTANAPAKNDFFILTLKKLFVTILAVPAQSFKYWAFYARRRTFHLYYPMVLLASATLLYIAYTHHTRVQAADACNASNPLLSRHVSKYTLYLIDPIDNINVLLGSTKITSDTDDDILDSLASIKKGMPRPLRKWQEKRFSFRLKEYLCNSKNTLMLGESHGQDA